MLLLVAILITRGPTRPQILDDRKGFGEPAPAGADPEATVSFTGANPVRFIPWRLRLDPPKLNCLFVLFVDVGTGLTPRAAQVPGKLLSVNGCQRSIDYPEW